MEDDIKFEVIKKIAETNFKYREIRNLSGLDSTSPPSVFIGSRLKYPLVNVGILSPLERDDDAWVYDDAKYWAENDFNINEVVSLRNSLLNSRFQSSVKSLRLSSGSRENKFIKMAQDIALASKPVDLEIRLNKKISLERKKDRVTMPQGYSGSLKKARITGNVKIHSKVEKVINDEIKASDGIEALYKGGIDEYSLSKILSVGALGMKKDKKLVPTRWSITATDDTLGNILLGRIKGYKWVEDYELFFGEFMGNQYLIMFFPNVWSYELFELYFPGSSWNSSQELKASTDLEFYSGRKSYAYSTAGGYYATRLPILEHLESKKRQASVLVIRLETPSYWAALGVWVVRESVRKVLSNRMLPFESLSEMMGSMRKISGIKFNFNPEVILKKSRLLEKIKSQKNLSEWVARKNEDNE